VNITTNVKANNQLTGTIPTELGQLINLTSMTLSSNDLSGAVPTLLGALVNLGKCFALANCANFFLLDPMMLPHLLREKNIFT
jgi:hypothetical protein